MAHYTVELVCCWEFQIWANVLRHHGGLDRIHCQAHARLGKCHKRISKPQFKKSDFCWAWKRIIYCVWFPREEGHLNNRECTHWRYQLHCWSFIRHVAHHWFSRRQHKGLGYQEDQQLSHSLKRVSPPLWGARSLLKEIRWGCTGPCCAPITAFRGI